MHKQILTSLFQWDSNQACESILVLHEKNGFCVVDYLYFANISGKKLFDAYDEQYSLHDFRDALLVDYKSMNIRLVYAAYQQSILDADLVLPDGIALQLFYFFAKKKRLSNLNGTDFCPYFLSYIKQKYPGMGSNIILYGTYPHLLEKTKDLLITQWYNVIYSQDGYSNLDWVRVNLALKWRHKHINILLLARSTPDYPIQEIWTLANIDHIREHNLIVMNQWGTFDFWVGEQKRAPKRIRVIKLERLRRLVSDPRRNMKKVLATLSLFGYVLSYLILKKR